MITTAWPYKALKDYQNCTKKHINLGSLFHVMQVFICGIEVEVAVKKGQL